MEKNILNDNKNDIVLTPSYMIEMMCDIVNLNKDSVVLDNSCGIGNMLEIALNRGCKKAIGIEYNPIVYNECKNRMKKFNNCELYNEDGLNNSIDISDVNVALLNPPYSFKNGGLVFVNEIAKKMKQGYICCITPSSKSMKEILDNCKMIAAVKLSNIFCGYANVQTSLYVFKVGNRHKLSDSVKFINMTDDGYKRTSRKNSINNLKDIDNADERYKEVALHILNEENIGKYYTKENGLFVEDTISLDGNDWTFEKHIKIDREPKQSDFESTIKNYMNFRCKNKINKIFNNEDPYFIAFLLYCKLNKLDFLEELKNAEELINVEE